MTRYQIRYQLLPAGTGPDDYEPSDLDTRTETYDLADPAPSGLRLNGSPVRHAPAIPDIQAAIRARHGLSADDKPIILSID
ncbi:hypothetical protein BJP40_26070 [Streptomyces sp. CC53]|uniref:hypothetical protein n=1 Tax=unclassified Streptomyces TaxID=2593676 RepID=UPI0008DD563D|nr:MULTISPECIES: hypothetical protein [unclassified Streptomyces]OII63104.1 hypothetical protein BJP40_26070 [Streptomyces sp. CC53]